MNLCAWKLGWAHDGNFPAWPGKRYGRLIHFDSFSVTDQIAVDPIAVCPFTVLYSEIYTYRARNTPSPPTSRWKNAKIVSNGGGIDLKQFLPVLSPFESPHSITDHYVMRAEVSSIRLVLRLYFSFVISVSNYRRSRCAWLVIAISLALRSS